MKITPTHMDLVSKLQTYVNPWRRITIAVDGVDGSGKSTLARFLAWQLGMPAIETDLFLISGSAEPALQLEPLGCVVESRHRLNRPVIVEGICILRTLDELAIVPDFLIRVETTGCGGSYSLIQQFESYAQDFPRATKPDFLFSRPQRENSYPG